MDLPYFASLFTPTGWLIILIILIRFILSSLSGILMIYLSIAVGQLFTDRRAHELCCLLRYCYYFI